MSCQLIRACIHLAVRETCLTRDQRQIVRRFLHLMLDQFMQAKVRWIIHVRVVPLKDDLIPLFGVRISSRDSSTRGFADACSSSLRMWPSIPAAVSGKNLRRSYAILSRISGSPYPNRVSG